MCSVICMDSVFCFFFKQKTAYEMRISDWSSDVCSSDLAQQGPHLVEQRVAGRLDAGRGLAGGRHRQDGVDAVEPGNGVVAEGIEIGRASCRERVCQYV